MTEKDLLKQLNKYKDIKADSTWKEENRAVLLNQITNSSSAPESGFSFGKIANSFKLYSDIFYNGIVKNLGQPLILTSMIVLTVLGGGIMSIHASRNTTPGDSLYIAKKISEKTQLAFAFSEKKKAKLNIVFAENRAKEIAQVMANEKPEAEKKEIVERLTGDFKNEISKVKTRINKINKDIEEEAKKDTEDALVEENLFTANLGKGKDGISISESKTNSMVNEQSETFQDEDVYSPGNNNEETKDATTTDEVENIIASSSDEIDEVKTNSQDLLGEVKELIENEDFDTSLEKLDQAVDNIDENIENGEVKGAMEENEEVTASTTEE